MPISRLVSHIGKLEYDILEEIGVPNSKVLIVSMRRPLTAINSTNVVFAVLPDLKSTSISLPALSMLRSSLIDLVLQQVNLTLTPSIFGQPSSFEVLKFPGGITVIPTQSASIWEITQILFNFTLNNSIIQIKKDLQKLKEQLKFGLDLRSDENVYVQLTNQNGSTLDPPVTVQASVLSDFGSRDLLPDRLKQLALVIKGSHAENFGLNHSIFGKVKEVVLSSYLQHSVSIASPSPSPSPSGDPPYSAPSSYAPVPSPDLHQPPCLYCEISSPTGSPLSSAPVPENAPQSPSQSSNSPGPSVAYIAPSPTRRPCFSFPLPPKASPQYPPASRNYAPSSATPQYKPLGPTSRMAPAFSPLIPGVIYGPSPLQDKASSRSPTPVPTSSAISKYQISHGASYYGGKCLIGLLVGLALL